MDVTGTRINNCKYLHIGDEKWKQLRRTDRFINIGAAIYHECGYDKCIDYLFNRRCRLIYDENDGRELLIHIEDVINVLYLMQVNGFYTAARVREKVEAIFRKMRPDRDCI